MAEISNLTVAQLSALIRGGHLSPATLVQTCLDRIAAFDPHLHAVNSLRAEAALDEARQAADEIARGGWRGPLHGIPVGIKDLIDVAGLPTTAQAAHRRGHMASGDAAVVQRLKTAGAVILSKLATHEYAVGLNEDAAFPAVRNPWDLSRDPCGSSSGSAVAVAAGLGPGAVGSDTAGSIRDPAAWCGVAGLKPTDGLIATGGLPVAEHWKLYLPALLVSFVIMVPAIIAAEKYGRMKLVFNAAVVVLLVVQIGFALFATSLYGLALWLTLFFVAFNILEATQPSLISRIAPPHAKGAALGVYNTTQALGLFVGGVLGGALAKHLGPGAVWACGGLLTVIWLSLSTTMAMPALRRRQATA
ncbi:MAG: MFS transporter [Candidatus Accumulibacter sp.]|uniref:MFS transporter n=1 Tax=Accumulibacter sp. TaxID=2053492 RepID=UPI001B0CA362|nr:MFS transporter [Accumulibacter sp.]MBO3703408.1 MFS transporter [Accumulibacter sp.]